MQKLEMKRIAQFYKIPMLDYPAPTDEDVSKAVAQRLTAQLEARQRQLTGLERERLNRFSVLARDMAADPELAQMLCLLLDDWHQRCKNPAGLGHLPQAGSGGNQSRNGGSRSGGRAQGAGESRSRSGRDRGRGQGGQNRRSAGEPVAGMSDRPENAEAERRAPVDVSAGTQAPARGKGRGRTRRSERMEGGESHPEQRAEVRPEIPQDGTERPDHGAEAEGSKPRRPRRRRVRSASSAEAGNDEA